MKKLFYVLCMSALIFTGCKNSASPGNNLGGGNGNGGGNGGGNGDGGGGGSGDWKTFEEFCKANPQSDPCPSLAAKTPFDLQDAKPVMKLRLTQSDILYGALNPSKWEEGYSDLVPQDDYSVNFSVESGSVLSANQAFDLWILNEGKVTGLGSRTITTTVGGNTGIPYESDLARVAIFEDLGKYLYLPPLRFAS